MTANRVVVVGGLNMDLIVRVPRLPAPGETVAGDELIMAPGGKGGNQAVAARRMGASVGFVGRVGADAFGEALLASLAAEGITVQNVARDAGASGVALISVDPQGENLITVDDHE